MQPKQSVEDVPVARLDNLPPLDILAMEVGYGLIPLVDTEQNGELLGRIKTIRSSSPRNSASSSPRSIFRTTSA